MELNTINDAFDRVVKKRKLSSSKSQDMIEQVSQEIEQVLSRMQSSVGTMSEPDQKLVLAELKTKLKKMSQVSEIENPQKELSVSLNKYLKILEKSFNPDISKAYRNVDFDGHTVNQILASHFYREGLFDTGDCFIEEANEPECADMKSPFVELYRILKAMRSGDLEPALEWAASNCEKLNQSGSNIELKLRCLQFIDILQKKGRDEALKYCRKYMTPRAHLCMPDIQKLMACLLWVGKLESSPYYDFFSPNNVEKSAEELAQLYCKLLGDSYESPLRTTIDAGVQGLPTLLKLMNVMTGKKQEWQSMKHLPMPVDLDKDLQFHSIFVCPVSRDQANEENPPMLLSCGHVLCKQSITKLSKNNSARPFKCPYCPCEVEVAQCRQLYF